MRLSRLEWIPPPKQKQRQSLRKQVRQATRYRNLNDHIRKAEATLFLIRWTDASEEMAKTQRLLEEAERAVGEMTVFTSQASTVQVEAASGLPQRRQAEAEAAFAVVVLWSGCSVPVGFCTICAAAFASSLSWLARRYRCNNCSTRLLTST